MKRKKFFPTYREAKKFLKEYQKSHGSQNNWDIYDLKKTFPNRKKTRYFVGDYYDWLSI